MRSLAYQCLKAVAWFLVGACLLVGGILVGASGVC